MIFELGARHSFLHACRVRVKRHPESQPTLTHKVSTVRMTFVTWSLPSAKLDNSHVIALTVPDAMPAIVGFLLRNAR